MTIILGDGTQFEAELNGNNYMAQTPIDDELLDDINLIGMTIDGVEQENTTCAAHWTDEYGEHIIFRQYTQTELTMQDLEAKIEYLAMMGDVEL